MTCSCSVRRSPIATNENCRGYADKQNSLPDELSGGERQRVAIARAVAGDPPLLLADEPTAALDAVAGLQVTTLLTEMSRERGTTVVVVTHDNRIYGLADRIVHIEDGQIADGTTAADAPIVRTQAAELTT